MYKRLSKPWYNLKIKLLENSHWLNFILIDNFKLFYTDSCLKGMVYEKVNQMSVCVQGDLNNVFLARGKFIFLMLQLQNLYYS